MARVSQAELQVWLSYKSELDKLQADLDKTSKKIGRVTGNYKGLHKASAAVDKAMVAGGVALGAAGVAIVKTTMDFDKQMSAVAAKTGATADDIARLRDTAKTLGAQTVYSASEAAQGMVLLGAAGLSTNDIIAAMPGLLAGAAASGADFAAMADIGVTAMSGFGLSAKDMGKISDILAQAANKSTADMTDLGLSLEYIGPIAKTVGINIEDTSAALAILANAGIKGEKAGTALRASFVRLAKPPKQAQKAMKDLGFTAVDANGKFKPLDKMLAELKKKFEKLTPAQKAQNAAAIFGTEAAAAMLALIDKGGPAFDTMAKSMDDATGSAQKQADVMNDNLSGAWEELKGSLETMAIDLGESAVPLLRDLTEAVKGWVDTWNKMDEKKQQELLKNIEKTVLILGGAWASSKVIGGIRDITTALGDVIRLTKTAITKLLEMKAIDVGTGSSGGGTPAVPGKTGGKVLPLLGAAGFYGSAIGGGLLVAAGVNEYAQGLAANPFYAGMSTAGAPRPNTVNGRVQQENPDWMRSGAAYRRSSVPSSNALPSQTINERTTYTVNVNARGALDTIDIKRIVEQALRDHVRRGKLSARSQASANKHHLAP